MKRVIFLCCIFLALLPGIAAESKQIHVLSVLDGNESGGVAEVFLEIRPGRGAVYLDSIPLTKLDTQISTRFAKEYACQLAAQDCSQLDFFYVIRAPSSIIGGPSAGAALTVLTYATLEDLELRTDTVMTGTINSGGLVGPVGGTNVKIVAARDGGFSRVLVSDAEYNDTIPILNIDVIPVVDIEEAIWYFTGIDIRPEYPPLEVPVAYISHMEEVAANLCTRAEQLRALSGNQSVPINNSLSKANRASAEGSFYSAASFCFSANLLLRAQSLEDKSQDELETRKRVLLQDIEDLDAELPTDITSIADLEVFMIVRERLIDAREHVEDEQYPNISVSEIAYSVERYQSALAWSTFFGALDSKELDLSEEQLYNSCTIKLNEAEERVNFLAFLIDVPLESTRQQILHAREDQRNQEYALCIFKASKAKAEADAVISALYNSRSVNQTTQKKIEKAGEILAGQSAKGNFPILAYSYYEYAQNLNDSYSANLYAEYALELASLDIYFTAKQPRRIIDYSKILLILAGIIVGFALGIISHDLWMRRKGS